MFLLLGDRSWVAAILVGLALVVYAVYRLATIHQVGVAVVIAAVAGLILVSLGVRRALRRNPPAQPNPGDTWR